MGKKILAICLLLSLLCVIGCSKAAFNSDEPPNAVGDVNGKQIQLIKGSYRWNNAIADAPSPDNLVKDKIVYVVKPNAKLTLDFDGKNPKTVSAGLWENHNSVPLSSEGDAIFLPSEPGQYVLSIWGEWSGDDRVSYAAAIEVIE
jgi:hypothetical protein